MSDLVKRLRKSISNAYNNEAADEIERLTKERDEALRFVEQCKTEGSIAALYSQQKEMHAIEDQLAAVTREREIDEQRIADLVDGLGKLEWRLLVCEKERDDLKDEIASHAPHGRNFTNEQFVEMRDKYLACQKERDECLMARPICPTCAAKIDESVGIDLVGLKGQRDRLVEVTDHLIRTSLACCEVPKKYQNLFKRTIEDAEAAIAAMKEQRT